MKERRKLRRFDLMVPANIQIGDPESPETQTVVQLTTRNISSTGAFFLTPHSIQPGTVLEVEMLLKSRNPRYKPGHALVKSAGQVVRTESDGIAVCFTGRRRLVPYQ